MSCACENGKKSREIERFRRLAKAWARLEGKTAVIFKKEDGSYGFMSADIAIGKNIIEYVTQY